MVQRIRMKEMQVSFYATDTIQPPWVCVWGGGGGEWGYFDIFIHT